MPVRERLTLEETAERLGRSPRTLEKWMRKGLLKYQLEKQNGKPVRMFDAEEVERLAEGIEEVQQKTGNRFAPLPKIENAPFDLAVSKPIAPPPPPRRNFTFSLPEGKIMAGFPAELSDGSVAAVRAFLELVLRQLPAAHAAPATFNVSAQ